MTRSVRTGLPKAALYVRVALGVATHYALRPGLFGWSPVAYVRFLRRALRLLLVFRHNRPVRTPQGWKLHLYLPAYPSEAFFHTVEAKLIHQPPGPSTVVYSMTQACRYKCPHCYQRHDTGKDVSDETLCNIARKLLDSGGAFFNIEGGEPFLRYERLIGLVSNLDPRSEAWINTTGDSVTPERLRGLRSAGAVGVMVSIHSPSAEAHDVFCGVPEAFDTACRCVRMATEAELVVALNSVLSEQEICEGKLDDLMRLADDLLFDSISTLRQLLARRNVSQNVRNADPKYAGNAWGPLRFRHPRSENAQQPPFSSGGEQPVRQSVSRWRRAGLSFSSR